MAANIIRWQDNLDRLEDELVPPPTAALYLRCQRQQCLQNHTKAILRRDYALFVAERNRQLQDAAAAKRRRPRQRPSRSRSPRRRTT